jgi:hypothetical protein
MIGLIFQMMMMTMIGCLLQKRMMVVYILEIFRIDCCRPNPIFQKYLYLLNFPWNFRRNVPRNVRRSIPRWTFLRNRTRIFLPRNIRMGSYRIGKIRMRSFRVENIRMNLLRNVRMTTTTRNVLPLRSHSP